MHVFAAHTSSTTPLTQYLIKGVVDDVWAAKTCIYGTRFFDRLAFAEQKDQLTRFPGLEFNRGLNRRAGIESCPVATGQAGAAHGRRLCQRTVAPDKLFSITSHRGG